MGKLIKEAFTNSKVSSHSVHKGETGNLKLGKFGSNEHKTNVSFKSGTKGAHGPTNN